MILKLVGWAIIAAGAFLWCGNVFHLFPTFPLAGYATMLVGGMVAKAVKAKQWQQARQSGKKPSI